MPSVRKLKSAGCLEIKELVFRLAVLSVVDHQPFAWQETTLASVPAHPDFSLEILTEMVARLSTVSRMMTVQLTSSVTGSPTPVSTSARLTCAEREQCVQLKITPTDVPAPLATNLTHLLKFDARSSRTERNASPDNAS